MAIRFTPIGTPPAAALPCWPGPVAAGAPLVVHVPSEVRRDVLAHLGRAPHERGGLLIGVPYRGPEDAAGPGTDAAAGTATATGAAAVAGTDAAAGPDADAGTDAAAATDSTAAAAASRVVAVRIAGAVAAPQSTGTPVSLSMDSAVWRAAADAIGRLRAAGSSDAAGLAALRVVGWYHSHPGLGAFFSDTDRRTQQAFFRQPWSLGWVIDPLRDDEAWFAGPDSVALPVPAR